MKFTALKSNDYITLLINDTNNPTIRKDIAVEKKIYVRGIPPSKEELEETITLQCKDSQHTRSELLATYRESMEDKIENEAREIFKSYMRIRNAISCIDLADMIEFGDRVKSKE